MVVMTDRVFLVNSWPFLVQNMQDIIESIQENVSRLCYKTRQLFDNIVI